MRKPFYWKSRGAWYVKAGRSQILLHADEPEAYRIWQEMQSSRGTTTTVALSYVAQAFLQWAQKNVTPGSFKLYTRYVVGFCNDYGTYRVVDIRPHDLTCWLDAKSYNPPSRRQAIISIKRCLNWSVDEGLIDRNPIGKVKAPPGRRREGLISDAQHAIIAANPDDGNNTGRDGSFRAFTIAMCHSGARPGTVAAVTAENVTPSGDAWIMSQHKNRAKTGKPLIVWLSPCLQTLTRIMAAARKAGPLFINSRGEPWSRNAIRQRMMRLRKKLGLPAGTNAYAYRHGFTTRALLNGTDIATVAELLGHSDVRMVSDHYGHLDKQHAHLRAAAAAAVRKPQPE